MKIHFFTFLLSFLISSSYPNAFAEKRITEAQALNILVANIKRDKLYDSWTTLSCLSFLTEEQTKDDFEFAIHEKHDGKCPGDPETSPV